MPEWSKFTDNDLSAIKSKLNEKFNKSMLITVLLSPLFCLLMPYIPSPRGSGPMIDRMPYWDAVLLMSFIWFMALIGIWIWQVSKTKKQYSQNRRFLRKKNTVSTIKKKSKTIFSPFDNILITEIIGELESIKIDKEQSQNLKAGDEIQIAYEEHTNTVLKLKKVIKD